MSAFNQHFNSTMVRLKEFRDLHHHWAATFQFHYGTIKSPTLRCSVDTVTRFQFHYGTIKSLAFAILYSKSPDFNSTMVRLKDYYANKQEENYYISIPLWYD